MSPKKTEPGNSWSDLNPRMTFYCPRGLQASVRGGADKLGISVTEFIVSAIRKQLPAKPAKREGPVTASRSQRAR